MKKLIFIIFSALTITSNAAFLQGTVSVDLTASGPYLVFSVRAYPGAGNVVDGWTTIDWFITVNAAYSLTFGTPVVNTTDFSGVSISYYGQNLLGSPGGGLVTEYWGFTGAATPTETYVDGTTYEMFRVPINTSSVDFGDIALTWDNVTYITYFTLTGSFGTDWTAAGPGANQPIFFGPGTYTGDNGNNFVPGVSGTANYTITDKPLIPMVLWDDAAWAGGSGTGNQPGAGDGAKKCYVRDINGLMSEAGAVVNDLIIQTGSALLIQPGASLTANGPTTITDGTLAILASASGVGSFIDNGTINYVGTGTALVETYLINGGTYYYHQVGPTVDNLGSGSGVSLGDFDITAGNTYAFEWNEATQTWVNQYATSYGVNTGTGLMLTTDDGSSGEYDQTGTLINTNVSLNLTLSGDPSASSYGWNLKSNPYSAALDWDDVWTREDPLVANDLNPIIYILNNGASNYVFYDAATNSGTMSKDIQVGQGFWVQYAQSPYSAPGNININLQPSDRNHSTTAFLKSDKFDQLTLTASGNNSADILLIAFRDYGTNGYDVFKDVDKWESYWEHATEIWTVSEDQKYLSQNILPTLGNTHVAVPMSFECHENTLYTITASDIESFQGNVEIYLEDLQAGGEWFNFLENNTYTFDGNPEDPQERFIVHFFGVTGIDDPEAQSAVQIYGYQQDAYIVNRSSQTIKEYHVYDMMGRELQSGSLPNSTVNKVTIGNVSAYYIVKVITKEGGVYTDKVYITK